MLWSDCTDMIILPELSALQGWTKWLVSSLKMPWTYGVYVEKWSYIFNLYILVPFSMIHEFPHVYVYYFLICVAMTSNIFTTSENDYLNNNLEVAKILLLIITVILRQTGINESEMFGCIWTCHNLIDVVKM